MASTTAMDSSMGMMLGHEAGEELPLLQKSSRAPEEPGMHYKAIMGICIQNP